MEKVNRWTQDEFDLYIDEVFSEWRRRSEHKWNIDLSFLKENFGIEVKGESAQNRAVRGVAAYEAIKQHREMGEAKLLLVSQSLILIKTPA